MANVLFLSGGGGGWPGAMAELKDEGHYLVGADIRDEHFGKYLYDSFYQVPRYDEDGYVDSVSEIVKEESIDYITGGHTEEFIKLQRNGFDNVLASDVEGLEVTVDKYQTYKTFERFSPDFRKVENSEELYQMAEEMGYPDRDLCIKPTVSSGGRGFKRIVEDYDRTDAVFNKKTNPYITLDELASLDFPPLLLMEYLEGKLYHVDILADEGEVVKAVVSYRLEEKFGYGFSLETEYVPEHVEMAEEIVNELNLDYNCFIQIIDGKLLEIGGRMAGSGPIGLDLMKGAVKKAEGKQPSKEIQQVRMMRYYENIFVNPESDDMLGFRDCTKNLMLERE